MPRSTSRASAPRAVERPAYSEALQRLYQRRRFGMRPGLEVISALLTEMGHPERSFTSVHVAGSKGKGSVASLVASALGSADPRVGLYTSPHLQSYRERIRVGGKRISPAEVLTTLAEVEAAEARATQQGRLEHPPTFFEATTALAFAHFARRQVRYAAVEVGLGGEFDATNVVGAPVGVITTIELEHTEVLGPTLSDVASAKAGILRRGMRAVTGEAKPEPLGVIERRADRLGVPLWRLGREIRVADRELREDGQRLTVVTPHREHRRLRIPLHGSFQASNLALAVAAIDLLGETVGRPWTERAIAERLARVRWRGRLERLPGRPPLYVDAAHTPESAHALAASLAEIDPFLDPERNVLLFGCLEGKRVEEILDRLAPLARTVLLAPIRSERSSRVAELQRAAFGRFPCTLVARSVPEGLRLARAAVGPGGWCLATGSDYLVGEVLNALEGVDPGEPDLSDPSLRGPGRGVRPLLREPGR